MRVKNWERFQHYQSGRGAPPWVKLYRDLLNDKEWFALPPDAAKTLINIWLLAAESNGELPDIDTIAFRLRLASSMIAKHLSLCSHWIINDASNVLAECYQLATPETETETETDSRFAEFWAAYPRKVGKAAAEKAFAKAKINGEFDSVVAALAKQAAACKDLQFFPHPATWLNGKRWEDEIATTTQSDLGVFV